MSQNAGMHNSLQDTVMAAAELAHKGVKRAGPSFADDQQAKGPHGMQHRHEKRTQQDGNLSHVQGRDTLRSAQVTEQHEGITDPQLTLFPTQTMVGQSQEQADAQVLVPPESPKGNLQFDDLSLTHAVHADGDCLPSSPFNTSAMAVLRQISDAYRGDACFAPENASRERMGIVEVVDQAQPQSQHALIRNLDGPARL